MSSWGVRMEFDPDVNACHVFPLGGSLDRVDPDVKRISFWGVRMEFDSDSNLLSEALGFSAGYTRVVTVTALWFSSPFSQFTFADCEEVQRTLLHPNGVLVGLMDGEVTTTEKSEDNAIFFTKEQFNAGLRFPLPSLFKEFLHFTQIPPAYIHPNVVRVLMGCSILSMLFNLDLSLLEVLFVYSLKKGKNDIFSMFAQLPSLQLVTELPDSTKKGAKGHVLVWGAWARLLEHPERPFSPNHSLVLPVRQLVGLDKRGRVVEWVEKASFTRLNSLFEIVAAERHHETLLTARNLLAVVREP
ncbi:hypothetical protein CK203_053229 [Vitis vinifera]|uniref:Uncharacterized protein n=1 Tax=Vitis vinifera TaxID=29760 RepID=A0A438GJZ1_VITVI|nr:hypothetical protein CK203_053229 [Vitis vinifera]